ncbi:unnamed protein product [Jaminaea pallidilutea]
MATRLIRTTGQLNAAMRCTAPSWTTFTATQGRTFLQLSLLSSTVWSAAVTASSSRHGPHAGRIRSGRSRKSFRKDGSVTRGRRQEDVMRRYIDSRLSLRCRIAHNASTVDVTSGIGARNVHLARSMLHSIPAAMQTICLHRLMTEWHLPLDDASGIDASEICGREYSRIQSFGY